MALTVRGSLGSSSDPGRTEDKSTPQFHRVLPMPFQVLEDLSQELLGSWWGPSNVKIPSFFLECDLDGRRRLVQDPSPHLVPQQPTSQGSKPTALITLWKGTF